jgi:hypothetical protein
MPGCPDNDLIALLQEDLRLGRVTDPTGCPGKQDIARVHGHTEVSIRPLFPARKGHLLRKSTLHGLVIEKKLDMTIWYVELVRRDSHGTKRHRPINAFPFNHCPPCRR